MGGYRGGRSLKGVPIKGESRPQLRRDPPGRPLDGVQQKHRRGGDLHRHRLCIDTGKGKQRQRVKEGEKITGSYRRVTTNVESGTETFDDPIGAEFAYSGTEDSPSSALEAQLSSPEAREAYALQQSVVGAFGAYSKQGAVQTRQQTNAFSDIMTRMEKQLQRDEMLEAHRQPNATARATPQQLKQAEVEAPPTTNGVRRTLREGAYREAFRTPSHVDQLRSMEGDAIRKT